MIKTLTTYFKKELSNIGYDDLANDSLSWSLYDNTVKTRNTSLYIDDAMILCNRLMAGKEKSAVKRAFGKGINIEAGGRYNAEFQPDNDDLTPLEIEACETFMTCIDDDLRDVEQRLLSEGATFFDATPDEDEQEVALERNLGRFRFVVSKVHCDNLFDFEEDYSYELVKSVISDGVELFDMKFELFDRHTDEALCSVYFGSMLGKNEDLKSIHCKEIIYQLSELVDEARTLMQRRIPKRDTFYANRAKERRLIVKEKLRMKEEAALKKVAEEEKKASEVAEITAELARQAMLSKQFNTWSGMSLA